MYVCGYMNVCEHAYTCTCTCEEGRRKGGGEQLMRGSGGKVYTMYYVARIRE